VSAISPLSEALNNPKRLEALHATALLDSPTEEAFDRLTRLASNLLEAPVSLVTLVDRDRQFFKSQFGLPEPIATGRQTPLSHAICQHVVGTGSPLVVADARDHPLLRQNLAVRDLRVVAYLGIPLTSPEGEVLGTLCTMDARVREWSKREVAILQDLAFSVMTEIELRVLAKQFQTNYLTLRDLELQRDEMVQMLVHDLRNPLTSLLGGLELVELQPGMNDDLRDCLGIARRSGESLLKMVGEILDVSKAEAGRLGLDLTETTPRQLIEDACAQIAQLALKGSVTLATDFAPGLPAMKADREKLRRVLVNLASNAIQHTPRNGTVTLSARASEDGKAVVFEVADTGSGIAQEAFGKIFEKFGQVKNRKSGRASTGLGLPFCRMAVEAHGGGISLESELGQGTVFRCVIPLGRIDTPEGPAR
jgi:signal transduction histidine kinase